MLHTSAKTNLKLQAVFQSWTSKISPSHSTGDAKPFLAQRPKSSAESEHEQNYSSPVYSLVVIMPGSQCVFNPATALRRVFMPANVGSPHSLHLTRIFVPALLALPPQARAYWAGRDHGTRHTPSRHGSSLFDRDSHARPTPASSLFNRRAAKLKQKKDEDADAPAARVPVKLGRMPRDNEIDWPYVYVKTPGVEGYEALSKPRPIKEVLSELDHKTTYLEAIAVPNKDEKDSPRWPICKIVNKKEELAKQKDMKERKKKGAVKEKEVELSWTLASHDLDHKLKTLQKFLGKGYKVQVLLQKKIRGKAKATEEDAKAIIERVAKAIEEVKGAKEWKGREGQILGSYRIFLQGKAADESATTTAAAAKETATASSDEVEKAQTASNDAAEESDGSSAPGQGQV